MTQQSLLLGVNIDHIATLRQARGTRYPDPIFAAQLAEQGGADGITLHLREDRRHIQERDVKLLKQVILTRMNLEMAVTEAMIDFALAVQPEHVCLVPEKREELTTEGGLDVAQDFKRIASACQQLQKAGCQVSLFIDPSEPQIEAAVACAASAIELHTGRYADAIDVTQQEQELERIIQASKFARNKQLIVNAGHGLNYQNVQAIARIPELNELNIGHAIIAQACFVGIEQAVCDMKQLMLTA